MYALQTKVILNKRLKGTIVDTKVVHRRITNSNVVKYKIFIPDNQVYYWVSDYYFIPMQNVKQNKIKFFFLNLLSKFVILKIHIDFKSISSDT